jgi:excisionase family DNA binding protein
MQCLAMTSGPGFIVVPLVRSGDTWCFPRCEEETPMSSNTVIHEPLWGPGDVATFLGVSRSSVYGWVARGALPGFKPPGSSLWRFRPAQIRALADSWFASGTGEGIPAARRGRKRE